MKPLTLMELKALLAAEGFAEDWAGPAGKAVSAPWYMRGMVAFGAWVAGVLMAGGLVVLISLDRSGPAMLITGLAFCAGACAVRWVAEGDFTVQLALASSVAGQVMAGFGMEEWLPGAGHAPLYAGMLALELVLVILFRDAKHRFLGTVGAGLFLCLLLKELGPIPLGSPMLGAALLAWWLLPPAFWTSVTAPFRRPILYGLAVAFCWPFLESALPRFLRGLAFQRAWGPGSWSGDDLLLALVPGLLLGVASLRVFRRLGGRRAPVAVAVGFLVWLGLALAGLLAPGVPAMLFVLVVAIEARESALAVLACVAGAGFLSLFYYDLGTTLLMKSGLLVGSGALLLALRFWLGREEATW